LASPDVASRRAVGRAIRDIYEDLGFLYIAGHGVPDDVVARAFAASRRFHALPLATKMALKINAAHRGYMPIATSTIVTSSVAKVTRPNFSESLMVMHEVAQGDPEWGKPLQGPNRWPEDLTRRTADPRRRPRFRSRRGMVRAAFRAGDDVAAALALPAASGRSAGRSVRLRPAYRLRVSDHPRPG
jgi:hypothetical protein